MDRPVFTGLLYEAKGLYVLAKRERFEREASALKRLSLKEASRRK